MHPERWRQIEQLFHAALEHTWEARGAFLEEACRGDTALRHEVESLLMRDSPSAGSVDRSSTQPSNTTVLLTGPQLGLLNGRYEIRNQLGQGGFGAVYLGVDRQLHDKRVVIKIMLKPFAADSWRQKKFREEIQARARINHPNVVQVTDSGQTPDGRPFLIMEYVDGLTLRTWVKQNGMDLKDAASIAQQLGAALTAAHSEHVTHRDLKPENILIHGLARSHVQAKLIDFGIATVEPLTGSRVASEHLVAGTIRYMAPEQLMGKPEPVSDIFSFGVVVFEMLTGTLPFEAETPVQLYALHKTSGCRRPRELRREIPVPAEKAIPRALSFRPEDRFPRASDFGEELARALGSSAPSTRPNLGALVTKMCNRRSQEDEFKSLFIRSNPRNLNAQMFILHGEEGECHESLVERLVYQAQLIAYEAGSEERPPVRLKTIPWQYEGGLELRKRHLFAWLIEQLGSPQQLRLTEASPASLGRLLTEELAFSVILQHDIRAARWDGTTRSLIQAYREFLGEIPLGDSTPRLLVFLNVIYPPVPQSSLNFMRIIRTMRRHRIQKDLRELSAASSSRTWCPCTILQELSPVSRDDVLEWFAVHGIGDSEAERLDRTERIFPRENSGLRRRMAEVETFLRESYYTFVS